MMARLAPFSVQSGGCAFYRSLGAGNDQLAAAIVIGDLANLCLRRGLACSLDIYMFEADDRCHGALARRYLPFAWRYRECATGELYRLRENVRAAANAEYSPSEWPAT